MRKAPLLLVANLCAAFAGFHACAQTAAGPAHPGTPTANSHVCPVRSAPLSAGEVALARGDSAAALAAFSAEMAGPGTDHDRARNGRIRALLAANRLDDARAEADAWIQKSPSDPWARTSLGQVQLRQGDIPQAYFSLDQAAAADHCNAQARAGLAQIYALSGMFATSKHTLDSAHALDPFDDEIERQWIESEPLAVQGEEIDAYIARATYLTDTDRATLADRQKRLALAASDTCQLTTPVRSTVLPYDIIQNGSNARVFWGLRVKINGKNFDLAEDSTISGIVLKSSGVKEAHLDPVSGVEVPGVGSSVARAATIDIGPLEFKNCDLRIAKNELKVYGQTAREQAHDVYLDRGSDGLIGVDAFRDFLITLDKPGRQLKLDPLPNPPGAAPESAAHLVTGVALEPEPLHDRYVDPSMQSWGKEFRSGQFFLFPLRLNQQVTGMYSLATSSILDTVSLDLARKMKMVGINPKELPSMTGHNSHYYRTSDATLDFLGMHERVDYLSAEDLTAWSHDHGLELTGMLGSPLLNNFTIHLDYRDNLMRIDFDPRRVMHCPPDLRMPGCY